MEVDGYDAEYKNGYDEDPVKRNRVDEAK